MKVNIVNTSYNPLPVRADEGSSGYDVYAALNFIDFKFLYDGAAIKGDKLILPPGSRALVPTGLYVAIPQGYEIQVRDRSGLALKQGLIITNGIGTIDSSYRGSIGVILTNTSKSEVVISSGERIAQLVLMKVETIDWNLVNHLDETDRGEGGFGSSGIK